MMARDHARARSDNDLVMIFLRGCILLSLVLEVDSFSLAGAVRVSRPCPSSFALSGVLSSRHCSSGSRSNNRCCIACRRSTHGAPDWQQGDARSAAGRLRSCITIMSSSIEQQHDHEHDDHAIARRTAAPQLQLNVDSRGASAGTARGRRNAERERRVGQGLVEGRITRGKLVQLGIASAVLLGRSGIASAASATSTSAEDAQELDKILVWSPKSEILKRAEATSGMEAPLVNETYPVRFVTYLARFLLNNDKASRELWEKRAADIPIGFSTLEVEAVRRDQFAEFAKAVQVGLLDYQGPQGIQAFFSLMRSRYGVGEDCKRQLAILFSFLEEGQPSELIEGLLGDIDNGQISSLVVTDQGGGYTGAVPKVAVSPSQAGRPATARAVLRETGHLVGIRLLQPTCDYSYKTPPTVRVSSPSDPTGVQAEAVAVLDMKRGFITGVELTNPGSGYSSALAPVTVEVFGEDNSDESGDALLESVLGQGALEELTGTACGPTFVAEAIIDREVGSIEILDRGDGYATAVPFVVEIQSPAECEGRPDGSRAYAVGLVAAGPSREDAINQLPVPRTSLTSKLAQLLPSAVADTLTINEEGRFESLDLVDLPVPSTGARKKGSMRSSTMFDPVFGPIGRSPLEKEPVLGVEDYLKLATAGAACSALVRLVLHPLDCVKTTVQAEMGRGSVGDTMDSDDGGWIGTVRGILSRGGVGELLRGIDLSTILGFILGFIGFGGTEFFRRELERMMEGTPVNTVWIILLASAMAQLISCLVTCPVEAVRIRVMTCDKRPEFLSFVGTAQEVLEQKGLASFWSGLGALLFRELPFAIAKFLTFELVRDKIFAEVPAAQESVFSALVVSIVAGMTAGVAGAIVSQPADTVLTRLNTLQPPSPPSAQVAPSSATSPWLRRPSVLAGAVGVSSEGGVFGGDTWRERKGEVEVAEKLETEEAATQDWRVVVREMFEGEGGVGSLFSGLGLRAVFFGAAIALQFFAFDYFKALLKVSPDDLQLVLDVFADRVSFYTGQAQDLL